MKKNVYVSLVFAVMLLAITSYADAQPSMEQTDVPTWYPERIIEDLGWGSFRQSHYAWIDNDVMKSIGIAQCSTDAASVEAAKYHAIAGLVFEIIGTVPEDTPVYYWPEMVYEVSGQVQVTTEGLAKKTNGQVMCIVSIKRSDAERIKAALTAKLVALMEVEHR